MHGEEEAGTEFFHHLDGASSRWRACLVMALASCTRGGRRRPGGASAADAAAQLVELGEAEFLRAVDEDGVGVGLSMPVSMMVVHSSRLARWR